MEKYTINFTELTPENGAAMLRKNGVLIVRGVFDKDRCAASVEELYGNVKKLCPKVSAHRLESWQQTNLPINLRGGLYQSVFANLPVVWSYRAADETRECFTKLYSGLRGREVTKFATSVDGMTFKPPIEPFNDIKDWAHLDQTVRDSRLMLPKGVVVEDVRELCIQGQVVLNDSTASFRCSPGSHLLYEQILDMVGSPELNCGNWLMFRENQIPFIKNLVEESGGEWQIPIRAEAGSMIFWLSSTIHSAIAQTPGASVPRVPFSDWRTVFYVCYRPQEEIHDHQFERLRRAVRWNRVTNHWGGKLFNKVPGRWIKESAFNPDIWKLINNPKSVYDVIPLEVDDRITSLITRL